MAIYDDVHDSVNFLGNFQFKKHDGSIDNTYNVEVVKWPLYFMNDYVGDLLISAQSCRWKIEQSLSISTRLAMLNWMYSAEEFTFLERIEYKGTRQRLIGYQLLYLNNR